VATLTADDLKPIVTEAIADWAKAGLPATQVDALSKVTFSVTDLPGSYLGWTEGNQVLIDSDAAGYGWFVDPTPTQDEEFRPTTDGGQLQAVDPQALAHMDLLTVVEHELGHVVGLGDLDSSPYDLMSGTLTEGVRRTVSVADIDAVFATYYGSNPS
jgi:predicted Zn-dependent protease